MGTFSARMGVGSRNGGGMWWVDAIVDTGAAYSVLPASILVDELGIEPEQDMQFTLADGTKRTFGVGEVLLSVEGQELVNRVVFGPDGRQLLGAASLQMFGLVADTTNHRLIPAPELTL